MVMRARLEEHHDDDGTSEILKRAMRKQSEHEGSHMEALLAAADELGISHDAIREAELEYRIEKGRARELELYRKGMQRAFRAHLVSYVSVNLFLFAINVATWFDDHEVWAFYPLLGWGIGLAIHYMTVRRPLDWDDPEFQKWRLTRSALPQVPPR